MVTARNIADYILNKSSSEERNDMSNLKLQKLLYYCQGFHLAIFNEPLFNEPIEHWDHGPVVPELYHEFKINGGNPIPATSSFNEAMLSSDSKQVIDEVLKVYDQFSAWKLRDMTHNEAPWTETKDCELITHEKLKKFFLTRLK